MNAIAQDRVYMPEPIAVSVDDGARLLSVSRAHLYKEVLSGRCPSVKIGNRRLLSVRALREWFDAQSNGGVA